MTRKFPPSVGGMQVYSRELFRQFRRHQPTRLIALRRRQIHLVWFLPWALLAGSWVLRNGRVNHLHVGDVALAPLGLLLARVGGVTVSVTAFGLDVVYPRGWYQWMVRRWLPRFDDVVCISRGTYRECVERGVDPDRCHVIPCGVSPPNLPDAIPKGEARREALGGLSTPSLENRELLLTVGRLIERKGVGWFIDEVVPRLPQRYVYLVAGSGPLYGELASKVDENGLSGRVRLLGRVSEAEKWTLYRTADCFIMPNRCVAGDREGFGIVALEAGAVGLPVVASGIEGVSDAVLDGETGILVEAGDPDAFVSALRRARRLDREKIRQRVRSQFSWEVVYRRYAAVLPLSRPPDA